MGAGRATAAALAASALALAGCRTPTQIEVDVSTNVACSDWQGSALSVGQIGPDLENAIPSTTSMTCDDAGHVGAVVVIPAGADNASVAIKVVGAVGAAGVVSLEGCTADAGYPSCIVARRALRFIPHEQLTLAMPLEKVCDDDPCAPDQTCVEGQCRGATIPDPTQCESQTCGEGVLPYEDGGGPDATVQDAGGDAGDGGGAFDATVSDADASGADGGDGGDGESPGDSAAPPYDAAFAGCGAGCALALGEYSTCVAREGGVTCAGEGDTGELGNGSAATPRPGGAVLVAPATPLAGATGIVSGEDSVCAWLGDGGVACWGGASPFASGGFDLYATPQPAFGGSPQIAMANYHMCWVTPARQLLCQAATTSGDEMASFDGDGGAAPVTLAPPAGTLPPFLALGTTRWFTCVLAADGSVSCLGDNQTGFESDPATSDNANVTVFTPVSLGATALDLALQAATACVRTAGGVTCWGLAEFDNTGGPGSGLTDVRFADGGSLAAAVQLTAGAYHTCARFGGGQVACWGTNYEHELGRGEPIATDGGYSAAAAYVVDADGGVFGDVAYVAAAAGGFHTCALKTDGTLWCWGDNSHGQSVYGGEPTYSTPAPAGF